MGDTALWPQGVAEDTNVRKPTYFHILSLFQHWNTSSSSEKGNNPVFFNFTKGDAMKELLKALGARLIAEGSDGLRTICHYLLPDGRVVEIIE